MERVYEVLDREGYTPEALASDELDRKRIAELTSLPDGAILSMQTLAQEWCKKKNKGKKRAL